MALSDIFKELSKKYKYYQRIGKRIPREGISDQIYKISPLLSTAYEVLVPMTVTYDSLVMKPTFTRGLIKKHPVAKIPLTIAPVAIGGTMIHNLVTNYLRGRKSKGEMERLRAEIARLKGMKNIGGPHG